MTRVAELVTVSNFFDTHRGGLEIVAGRLARELSNRGFQVTWLATDATQATEVAGVRTVSVPAFNATERRWGVPFPVLGVSAARRVASVVRDADAVLLHDSLYMISVIATCAAKWYGKPLIVVQHIGEVPYRSSILRTLMAVANRTVARWVLARADQAVFISAAVRDFFASLVKFRCPPRLLFNGVDADLFHPEDALARLQLRERFGFAGPVALFVGRFVEKKGLHLLRRVVQRRPDLTWAFAGWGVLDPTGWGLPNVRVFSGLSGKKLAELYQASDVFVLPSRGEGFPLVVQEALACGLPVICGSECALADPAAAHLLTTVELDHGSDEDLSQDIERAIGRVLRGDPVVATTQFEIVRQRYGWHAVADDYAGILRELLEQLRVPQNPRVHTAESEAIERPHQES